MFFKYARTPGNVTDNVTGGATFCSQYAWTVTRAFVYLLVEFDLRYVERCPARARLAVGRARGCDTRVFSVPRARRAIAREARGDVTARLSSSRTRARTNARRVRETSMSCALSTRRRVVVDALRGARAVANRASGDPRQPSASTENSVGKRATSWFEARESDEMPLRSMADAIGNAFAPALDAIAEEQRRRASARGTEASDARGDVYVPDIPVFLCATRLARDSPYVRSVLVHDERAPRTKPRLSWYDARDDSWVPRGWFDDGLKADLEYYFGEKAPDTYGSK